METEQKPTPAKANAHELPNGWEWRSFGSVLSKSQYGLTTNASENGQYPMFRMNNFVDGKMVANDMVYVDLDEKELKAYLLKPGDILFNRTNSYELVGKTGLFNLSGQFIFASYLVRLKADSKQASPEYLNYFLNWNRTQRQLKKIATLGVSQCNINPTSLGKFLQIPLPPLAEQRKIATVLSTWDDAIQTARQLLTTKQQRKRALMQQLLTGNTRLPGFSDDWHEVKAGKIFRSVSIKNKPEEILLSATQEQGVVPRSSLEGRVTMPKSETKTYKLVEQGDFVISLRSFQGGIEYSEHRGIVSPAYTVLKPVLPVDKSFYKHYYKSERFIRKLGVAIIGIRDGKQISFDDFSVISIPYPDPDEQRAIASVLNAAETEIRLATAEVDTLQRQKRGLMQQLLTGKRRVSL